MIKTMKELQANLKQWVYLTDDEREVFERAKADSVSNITWLNDMAGMWEKEDNPDEWLNAIVYQLAPDYQPEPEIIDCPVLPTLSTEEFVKFRHYDGNPVRLHKAYSYPGFEGFKFYAGKVLPYPIRFRGAGIQNIIGQSDGEVEHCTHIRLRRLK